MSDHVRVQLRLPIHDSGLLLLREVRLPGIPRPGELVRSGPSWDPLVVRQVAWRVDDPGDDVADPAVAVALEPIDMRIVADDLGDGIEAFRAVGWQRVVDESDW